MNRRRFEGARKVNPFSEEHLTHAEVVWHQRFSAGNSYLGQELLDRLSDIEDTYGEYAPQRATGKKQGSSAQDSKERMITEARRNIVDAMRSQIAFALFSNPTLFIQRFRSFLQDPDTPPLTVDRLKRIKLEPDHIVRQSFRDLYWFLLWNRETVQKQQDRFENGFQDLAKETLRYYTQAARRGIVLRSEGKVKNMLASLNHGLQDALLTPGLMKGAVYEAENHMLWMPSHFSGKEARMAYLRGVMHALAGKTLLSVSEGEERLPRVIALRNGFLFGDSYNPFMPHDVLKKKRFQWIDEALTTELLFQTLGQRLESQSPENKLVNLLCREGKIPKHLLFEAYFEDYDEAEPSAKRSPLLRSVLEKFSKTFGSSYLPQIDDQVQERGVGAVLRDMENLFSE